MIKTTELRLNNIVKIISGEIVIIENIGFNGVELKSIAYPIVDSGIEPITLTPAVLEACGFEYDESNIKWKINKNSKFEFAWGEECGTQFNYSVCRKGVSHVNFLHQLQNLYYSLTDQELKIDIEKLKNAVK